MRALGSIAYDSFCFLGVLCTTFVLQVTPSLAHEERHDRIEKISLEIEKDPDNVDLYLKRGELHRVSSHWHAALEDFDRVAQLDPSHEGIEFHRGRLLFEAGQLDSAISTLDQFLSVHPDHVRGLIIRGRVLSKLGFHLQAARDYTDALSLMKVPTPVLFVERAHALAAAGDEYLDEAVQGLDEGARVLGSLILLESLAIALEEEQGKYDAALARIERLLTKMPRKEKWLVRRGEILEGTGRNGEARAAYEEALRAMAALPSHHQQATASRELATYLRARLESME